jgi:hypothetical protein
MKKLYLSAMADNRRNRKILGEESKRRKKYNKG